MGLLKTRPDVSLYAPRLIDAGREYTARVVLRCPAPLPVSAVVVEFVGEESWYTQSQYGRHGESSVFFRATSRPFSKGELSEGEHEFDVRFEFPATVPNSYRGRHVEISYTARVHVDIPWWPAAKARFVLNVRGADPPKPPSTRRQVFVSALEGPHTGMPYFELSLSSHELEPGGRVRGSVALAGVDASNYEQLQATLWAVERVTGFLGAVEHFVRVAQWNLEIAPDGEDNPDVVPLNLRLPANLAVGFEHRRVALSWRLQVEAVIAWTTDPSMMVPVYVRHRRPGEEEIESLPPAVGSRRQQLVWREAGRRSGFDFAEGILRRTVGKTEVRLFPESRRTGSWVVGEIHFVDLGLGLGWKSGALRSRERRQLEALQAALGDVLSGLRVLDIDDTRMRFDKRGDRNVGPLVRFAEKLHDIALAIEDGRAQLPPPQALEHQLDDWRDAAHRLGADLHVGSFALSAEWDGHRVEVRTRFKPTGQPDRTTVGVFAPELIGREHRRLWHPGSKDPLDVDLPKSVRSLQINAEATQAELHAPVDRVVDVVETVESLLTLTRRFMRHRGPYR